MVDEKEIVCGSVLDESWLTVEQLALLCEVEPQWLIGHLEAGLFRYAESIAVAEPTSGGRIWRFQEAALQRALRMRRVERDFDAAPELAALVADLLEEIDTLRRRLRRAGLED